MHSSWSAASLPLTASELIRSPTYPPPRFSEAFDEQSDALVDAAFAGFRRLAFLDAVDETLAVGNGKGFECCAARRHGICQIAGDGYLPFGVITFDRNVDRVPYADAQFPPNAAVDE